MSVTTVTLNEANPLAAYPDDDATTCFATDLIVPTPSAPAVTCAAVKITKREKTNRSGEAIQEHSRIEAPLKSS